jgi:tRNA(fMet)-specific endonuclease VapC
MDAIGYLLDTNIISALARDPRGPVFVQLRQKLPATICTSIVVAAEIEFGLAKGVSERMRAQVLAIMATLDVLPLAAPVHQHYGEIRALLTRQGQPIGPNDLFIAAHARALGMTLVSNNLREFERVPDLKLENWLHA